MKIVAQRSPTDFLIDLGNGQGQIMRQAPNGDHTMYPPMVMASLLARGYWQAVDGDPTTKSIQVSAYERDGEHVSAYVRHSDPHVSSEIVKTAAEAAKARADALIASWHRDFDKRIKEVRDLPEYGEGGVHASVYVGGMSISRHNGKYGIVSSASDVRYMPGVSEEELPTIAHDLIDQARPEIERSWRSIYRGKITKRSGENIEMFKTLDAAVATNDANPAYHRLREWADIPDVIVPVEEAAYGTQAFADKDVLTTAFRSINENLTTVNALAIRVFVRMRSRLNDRGEQVFPAKPIHPGIAHATDGSDKNAGLLRHEWAHSLFAALSDEQRDEFAKIVPDNPNDVASELSSYAATHLDPEDPYYHQRTAESFRERWGPNGHMTETFSEAVTVVTDPDFKRDEWAPWVGEIADWIDKLTKEPKP